MKKIIFVVLLLLITPFVLAIDVEVNKISQNEVYVQELNKPVHFDVEMSNYGVSEKFTLYNLLGFEMSPKKVNLGGGETKEIQIEVQPLRKIEEGFYTLPYFVKSSDGTEQEESLTFKVLKLENAFEIGSGEVDTESRSLEIFIRNKENFDFGDVSVEFQSPFFSISEETTLGPKETKRFSVNLDKEDFRDLMAGFYTLNAEVDVEGEKADVEGVIKFKEKDLLTTTKKEYGFLINTLIIEKENEGNTISKFETVIKKNIISRLFTSFSPEPNVVEREGGTVYYTWIGEITPGEKQTISIKTNWLVPFLIVLLVVVIAVFVRKYSGTNLSLRKKVSFVKTKGGEFALKITVTVNAKKFIERVNIIDRLPPLVDLYEKFGSEEPTRIDKKTRRIEWNFEKLEPGEVRILSYIIYSKVGIMGKFALPTTTAVFEKEGEIHETESNRAYFVTEPVNQKEDE